jgi:hypothetical protein
VIVAGLLRLIAAGLEPVDTEPYRPGRLLSIATASGWWLMLQIDGDGQPVELHHAQAPSLLVPPWTYGCQRDDWTLGPDSRVITPVELLTVEQREALRCRLERAPVVLQFRPLPVWDVSNLDDELILD